jgi:hypothetical protein
MVLKMGHLAKYVRNNSKVLECGAGEDQLNPFVRNEHISYCVKEGRNVLRAIELKKANWIGHIFHRN